MHRLNHFHRFPERKFSAASRVMPRSRPSVSGETHPVSGLVRDGNRWLFYYGGADKYVGVASAAFR
jgi:hypothetical protein